MHGVEKKRQFTLRNMGKLSPLPLVSTFAAQQYVQLYVLEMFGSEFEFVEVNVNVHVSLSSAGGGGGDKPQY